jgi:hypothetical protein
MSTRTNQEAPNTLKSNNRYKVLDALCEGEIDKFVVRAGTNGANPLVSTYFDNVPVINTDGSSNYNTSGEGFQFSYTCGTTGQPAIPGFEKIANLIPLPYNTRVANPPANNGPIKNVVSSFNTDMYPDADSIRLTVRVPSLSSIDDNGNTDGYSLSYAVDIAVNGGAFTEVFQGTISGKCTQPYLRDSLHVLPKPGTNESYYEWKVRVRRTTQNILSVKVQNELFVESIAVISNNSFSYPNTALVALEISADQFSTIPTRAYEVNGLLVKIPVGYTPTRYNTDGTITAASYPSVWNGSFYPVDNANKIVNGNFSSFSSWGESNVDSKTTLTSADTTGSISLPSSETSYAKIVAGAASSTSDLWQSVSGYTVGRTYKVSGYIAANSQDLLFRLHLGDTTPAYVQKIGTAWTYFEVNVVAGAIDDHLALEVYRSDGNLSTDDIYYLAGVNIIPQAKVWTDNPAWIFYDIVTNKRYGLGQYIPESLMDKWTLYSIAQYCDELVDNGAGGLEPRFTINAAIRDRQDAYQLLQNLVSAFQGMMYWAGGQIMTSQVKDGGVVQNFTQANVINGSFTYSDTARNTRSTVVKVKWINPDNLYKDQVEYIEDIDGIARYGYIEKELTAFACTSRAQAIRMAHWTLLVERSLTETITFQTGAEGFYTKPGDIFSVYDNYRKSNQQGGRITGYDVNRVTINLDREIFVRPDYNYQLSLTIPSANIEPSGVTGSNQIAQIRQSQVEDRHLVSPTGYTSTLTVDVPFSSTLNNGTIWILKATGTNNILASAERYRCLATSEVSQGIVEVLGLEWNTGINYVVDSGYNALPNPPNTGDYSSILPPNSLDLQLITGSFINNAPILYIAANWNGSPSTNFSHYEVSGQRRGIIGWELLGRPSAPNISQIVSHSGLYDYSIQAVSVGGIYSTPLLGTYTMASKSPFAVQAINSVFVTGDNADYRLTPTGYINDSLTVAWDFPVNANDYVPTPYYFLSGYQVDLRHPISNTLLDSARIPSRDVHQYDIDSSIISAIGDLRSFKVNVTPFDLDLASGVVSQIIVNNPAPNTAKSQSLYALSGMLVYNVDAQDFDDLDINNISLWYNNSSGFTPTSANINYVSRNLGGNIPTTYTGDYYAWFSLADTFGTGDVNGPIFIPNHYFQGAPGPSGSNGGTIVSIYQRNTLVPSTPTSYVYPPASWYTSLPVDNGDAAWISQALETTSGIVVDSSIGSPWSTPRRLSGNINFYQSTAPGGSTSLLPGDTWWDTANNYRLSRWNGASWTDANTPYLTYDANGNFSGVITGGQLGKPLVMVGSAFQIWDGSSPRAPFTVSGGNVYITSGFIENLSFGQIRGGKATAQELVIANNGPTYGLMRSDNYSSGVAGWAIRGDGYFEAQAGIFRGYVDVGVGLGRFRAGLGEGSAGDTVIIGEDSSTNPIFKFRALGFENRLYGMTGTDEDNHKFLLGVNSTYGYMTFKGATSNASIDQTQFIIDSNTYQSLLGVNQIGIQSPRAYSELADSYGTIVGNGYAQLNTESLDTIGAWAFATNGTNRWSISGSNGDLYSQNSSTDIKMGVSQRQSVLNSLNLFVNVRDFGAVGNGSTDDTTAIQAAFDYADTLKGSFAGYSYFDLATVFFPHGTYRTTSTLNWKAHHIEGSGPHSSVVLWDGTSNNQTALKMTDGNAKAHIEGIWFNCGPNSTEVHEPAIWVDCSASNAFDYGNYFENVYFGYTNATGCALNIAVPVNCQFRSMRFASCQDAIRVDCDVGNFQRQLSINDFTVDYTHPDTARRNRSTINLSYANNSISTMAVKLANGRMENFNDVQSGNGILFIQEETPSSILVDVPATFQLENIALQYGNCSYPVNVAYVNVTGTARQVYTTVLDSFMSFGDAISGLNLFGGNVYPAPVLTMDYRPTFVNFGYSKKWNGSNWIDI